MINTDIDRQTSLRRAGRGAGTPPVRWAQSSGAHLSVARERKVATALMSAMGGLRTFAVCRPGSGRNRSARFQTGCTGTLMSCSGREADRATVSETRLWRVSPCVSTQPRRRGRRRPAIGNLLAVPRQTVMIRVLIIISPGREVDHQRVAGAEVLQAVPDADRHDHEHRPDVATMHLINMTRGMSSSSYSTVARTARP